MAHEPFLEIVREVDMRVYLLPKILPITIVKKIITIMIKTHNGESQVQEEAQQRDR